MELVQIQIACQGAITIGLDELNDLQGNLKELSEENYVKLRNSMLKYGFSFPVFIWIDSDNKKWTIDAHQRTKTLKKMKEEGYTIPPLPADIIQAKDKNEAKEKLLLLNSRYGEMTQEGFDTFISDIPMDDISDLLVIPDVMIEGQNLQDFSDKNKEINPEEIAKDLNMKCPKCGFEFKGKEGLDAQVPIQMESE